MIDRWHLFDSILPERLVRYHTELRMHYVSSVYKFEEYYNKGIQVLKGTGVKVH